MPFQDIVPYNEEMPSSTDSRIKTAVMWGNSNEAANILNRHRENFLKSKTKKGLTGYNI